MQTNLAPEYQNTPDGLEAEAILRKCVHCGFCTATCPTYQLLGDELDGPRGRIYLMKAVLEGETPTRKTQMHLDRCLTCRNCESTCPSGVQYGHLVDIGRKLVDAKVERPAGEKLIRWALKEGLPSPLFAPAMKMGQMVRGLLPESLKAKVPAPQNAGAWPTAQHARKVLMLAGCVQPSMSPNINTATARVARPSWNPRHDHPGECCAQFGGTQKRVDRRARPDRPPSPDPARTDRNAGRVGRTKCTLGQRCGNAAPAHAGVGVGWRRCVAVVGGADLAGLNGLRPKLALAR